MEWQNVEFYDLWCYLKLRLVLKSSLWQVCIHAKTFQSHLLYVLRHDDEARDLALKPEWNQYTPQFGPFFENDPVQSSKCPYGRHR